MIHIEFCSLSDKGKVRSKNEDYFLNDKNTHLFMIADGLGGYEFGEVASKMALTSIQEALNRQFYKSERVEPSRLCQAITTANQNIVQFKSSSEDIENMGTTVVCFQVDETGKGIITNVGDSRFYKFRNSSLEQITQDHSLAAEMPDFMKDILGTKAESVLTRSLGSDQAVEPDVFHLEIEEGDIYMMCTDGLYSMVSQDDIKKILGGRSRLNKKCLKLIELANRNGGEDNITVTLLSVKSVARKNLFKVLLVEDDISLRATLTELLQHFFPTVHAAENGKTALRFLQQHDYDLIVMDNKLPFADGSDLLALIKLQSPNTKIVMMSAFFNHDILKRIKEFNPSLVVDKPVDIFVFQEFVAENFKV